VIIKREDVLASQALLGIEGIPLDEDSVRCAYRTLAKKHHPDAGGDAAQFAAIDRAKHLLLAQIKRLATAQPQPVLQKEDCANCGGRGRVVIRKGFATMTITCNRCKGSGDMAWDEDTYDT
jgi:DnaJ-class molecular chaperone